MKYQPFSVIPKSLPGVRAAIGQPLWLSIIMVIFLIQQGFLWWLYYAGGAKQLVGDEFHYLNTALAILKGGAWHSSDIWPPGQPLLIAFIFLFTGKALWSVQVVQTALFLGCGALLWRLWRNLTNHPTAASFATALFLLNPSNAAYAHYLWPEIPHLFMLLAALNLLLPRIPNPMPAMLAGATLGLALIFKSVLAGYWPLLIVCFIADWRSLRVAWQPLCAFLLGLMVIISPALDAGHRNTGHWRIADSSTFNLLAGLNDRARNDYADEPVGYLFQQYIQSGITMDERNIWASHELHKLFQRSLPLDLLSHQLGQQYFRLLENKTLLLSQLPGPACAGYLSAYQAVPETVATSMRWIVYIFHALTLTGFAFGLCLWRDWHKPWVWLLLAFISYQLALYLGLHVKARYLFPMVPVFCGFAGHAFANLKELNLRQMFFSRLLLGGLFSIMLLFFAFGGPWLDNYCRN